MRSGAFIILLSAVGTALPGLVGAQTVQTEGSASCEEEFDAFLRTSLGLGLSGSPSVLANIDFRRADAATRKIVRALKTTQVGFEIEKQPLEAVLDLFRKLTGVNFVLSAKAAESAKSDKVEVTFTLKGLPLENVLNLLMLQLKDYRFVVRYAAVMLLRTEEYKPETILRVYDVRDLVRPRPDFAAPQMGLGKKNGEE